MFSQLLTAEVIKNNWRKTEQFLYQKWHLEDLLFAFLAVDFLSKWTLFLGAIFRHCYLSGVWKSTYRDFKVAWDGWSITPSNTAALFFSYVTLCLYDLSSRAETISNWEKGWISHYYMTVVFWTASCLLGRRQSGRWGTAEGTFKDYHEIKMPAKLVDK